MRPCAFEPDSFGILSDFVKPLFTPQMHHKAQLNISRGLYRRRSVPAFTDVGSDGHFGCVDWRAYLAYLERMHGRITPNKMVHTPPFGESLFPYA